MRQIFYIRLFVDDQTGVLDQISVLVRRSGWNVRAIHSCNEAQSNGTRVLLSVSGRADLRLLLAQLERLDCVRELSCADESEASGRELALARSSSTEALAKVAADYGAHLLLSEQEGDTYELSADEEVVSRFLAECVSKCGAKTMRSGAIYL